MVQSSLRGKKEEMLKELEAVITGEHLMVTRELEVKMTPSNEIKCGTLKLYLTFRNLLLLALFPFSLTLKSVIQAQTISKWKDAIWTPDPVLGLTPCCTLMVFSYVSHILIQFSKSRHSDSL